MGVSNSRAASRLPWRCPRSPCVSSWRSLAALPLRLSLSPALQPLPGAGNAPQGRMAVAVAAAQTRPQDACPVPTGPSPAEAAGLPRLHALVPAARPGLGRAGRPRWEHMQGGACARAPFSPHQLQRLLPPIAEPSEVSLQELERGEHAEEQGTPGGARAAHLPANMAALKARQLWSQACHGQLRALQSG
jgi:hypothetical protein